jgi:Leucine Rich repeats (2 copies)
MTPEEERDYQEALRRIKEAEEKKSVELDLIRLEYLTRIPPELASLTSLQSLNLSECRLTGDLRPLAKLKSLQTLSLSGCKLSDLSPLAELKSLQTLDLSMWQLSWRTPLSDLSPLAELTLLQTLNLAGWWHLSDLSPLEGLTSLQTLNLAGCEELSDLRPLAKLKSLQTLDLTVCEQLSDLSPLERLTSLQTLDLSGCVGIRRFSPLKSLLHTLSYLCLARCKFEDLPSEVCGYRVNVLDKVRAYFFLKRGSDTANGHPNITEVVLLIHGIRDFAEWQDMVSTVLAEIPATEISPLKYGRFDALKFWFPLWTRRAPIRKILRRIRDAHARNPSAKLSVIAHSFGTYAIGKILNRNPDHRIAPTDSLWGDFTDRIWMG